MTTFEDQFNRAWKLITPVGKVTISYLQRKMGIDWNRGAKIVEEMEKRGIIGQIIDFKPREVLKKYKAQKLNSY